MMNMGELYTPTNNRLIAALPVADYERLLPHLELVPLVLGKVIYEAGEAQPHVFFPIRGVVSLLQVMRDGFAAEIAVVGNEGMVGISLFMGGESTPGRAIVQRPGYAYRLKGSLLKGECERNSALQYLLLRYTQSLITEITQTAACNRHHAVEQQLCRWLLLSLDRESSSDPTTTVIGNILGVRRDGVAEAANSLKAAGFIDYTDGKITVLDRLKLEARVCECYGVVRKETDRLFARKISSL
jgi:CRP-like cAMP-binding protein